MWGAFRGEAISKAPSLLWQPGLAHSLDQLVPLFDVAWIVALVDVFRRLLLQRHHRRRDARKGEVAPQRFVRLRILTRLDERRDEIPVCKRKARTDRDRAVGRLERLIVLLQGDMIARFN